MIDRRPRLVMIGLLLGAVVGCDSNPGGPSAPTAPVPGAAGAPASTAPGVMPGGKTSEGRPAKGNGPSAS